MSRCSQAHLLQSSASEAKLLATARMLKPRQDARRQGLADGFSFENTVGLKQHHFGMCKEVEFLSGILPV